jgi:hydroxyethylthiazole kinase-like uncharacterized protein yjeF
MKREASVGVGVDVEQKISLTMKIFTSEQVREIDKYTIENEPIVSTDLMERAAQQITAWLTSRFDLEYPFVVFAGPGNNGGDGLVTARLLAGLNYIVRVCLVKISDRLSTNAQINLDRLKAFSQVQILEIKHEHDLPDLHPEEVILDAIFGSGLTRPAKGLAARTIEFINSQPNQTIAIDIPSGLFGEDNPNVSDNQITKADQTIALQFPSLSFLFAENEQFAGEWSVVPIGLHPAAIEKSDTPYHLVETGQVQEILRTRSRFAHKGNFGNALLIAGCYGMMGAAVLGGKAALRTGSGLVTLHVPRFGYQIVQTSLPEALISIDESDIIFSGIGDLASYQAIGVGPGLGCKSNTRMALYELIKNARVPMVIDADALNIISSDKEWLNVLPSNTILTPHPKEFDRLAGDSGSGFIRNQKQIGMAKKYNIIIVLKGAFTSIALPDGSCYFNPTGNPGMATAGSGDVLTGIVLSLLSQGYQPDHAAILGVYLHGMAGDLAAEAMSEEALMAGDIIENIGPAYQYLKNRDQGIL